MKYAPHLYAKALVEVLGDQKADQEEAAKHFLALVRKNGDEGRLGKILEEASRLARGRNGVRKVTIESARALTPAQESALRAFMGPGDVVEKRIAPELVAGVKIILDDELQFDGSMKHKLDRALGNE